MNKSIKTILILVVILIAGSLGYVFLSNRSASNEQNITNHPLTQPEQQRNQEPDSQEVEVITSDIDASDWKTYRNEEFGFSLKYPSGWQVEVFRKGEPKEDPTQSLLGVFFSNKTNPLIFFITVDELPIQELGKSTSEIFEEYILGKNFEKRWHEKDVVINGINTKKYSNNISRIHIPFLKDNYLIVISWNTASADLEYSTEEMLDAVLNTFKLEENNK